MIHLLVAREKGPLFTFACGGSSKDPDDWVSFLHHGVTCLACLSTRKFSQNPLICSEECYNIKGESDLQIANQQPTTTLKGNPEMPTQEKNPEAPAAEEAKAPKKEKAALPEGFVTPVAYAKTRKHPKTGEELRPQIIYGYIKNNGAGSKNPFPCEQNSDGAWMVNKAKADEWLKQLEDRKATRAAEKAAKDASKEAAPAETPAS